MTCARVERYAELFDAFKSAAVCMKFLCQRVSNLAELGVLCSFAISSASFRRQ